MFHLDLCLEYMEIVDKQIVDEIPKIFIMMLVHKVNLNLGYILKVICGFLKWIMFMFWKLKDEFFFRLWTF